MNASPAYLLSPEFSARFYRRRISRLYDELGFALSRMEGHTLRGWGGRSASRLLMLTGRRVGGLARLATLLARAGGGELMGALKAYRQSRLSAHMGDRAAATIDGTIAIGRDGARMITGISRALVRDPKATAPAVLGGLLGFSAGSGGLDANGGIPDLDLVMGIGAHRSALTHTLIAGIVAEGLLLALADLAAEVHGRLPHDHDPIWDDLARIGRPLAQNLAIGTSAGLAYHLLVDALVQPAALHGLPVEMPMEGHQAVMATSGLAEATDAVARSKRGAVEIVQGGPPEKSTGRKVVDAVGESAESMTDAAARHLNSAFRRWKGRA